MMKKYDYLKKDSDSDTISILWVFKKLWRTISNNKGFLLILFVIFIFLIVEYYFIEHEPHIPPNFIPFCSPEQFLVFLTITGLIVGIYFSKSDELTPKIGDIVIFLFVVSIILGALFLPFPPFTSISIIILDLMVGLLWKYRNSKKVGFNETWFLILILVSISYIIAGSTGNACQYIITGAEYIGDTEDIYYEEMTYAQGTFGIPEEYPEISCSSLLFKVDKYSESRVIVSIYNIDNESTNLIKKLKMYEGEFLTLCCFRWKLISIDDSFTKWRPYSMYDIFCSIQNIFHKKGVYRTGDKTSFLDNL